MTRKSDVYSFGVLLLEIVSGRCNTNTRLPYEDQFLLERVSSFLLCLYMITSRINSELRSMVYPSQSPDVMNGLLLQTWALYENGNLARIIDTSLNDDLDAEEACKILKIGLLCTQDAAKSRPTMSTVVKMMTGEKDIDSEEITRPAVINDFMELKVRSQRKAEEIRLFSTMSSSGVATSALSSEENSHGSLTYTAISDRD